MKKSQYSIELANIVKQFLTEDDWQYSFDEDNGVFDFGLRMRSKIQQIKYLIAIQEKEIVVYGISPIGVNPDDMDVMANMAEFICRANFGLKNGNFELDFTDGEIRYKTYIDCDGIIPSPDVVKNCINCTSAMYRSYADGITAVIFAEILAEKALAMCEKSPT